MIMSKEFELLDFFLKVVERKIDSRAFVMFKEGSITIAFWDDKEKLHIVADALVYPKFEKTLFLLYQQTLDFYKRSGGFATDFVKG